MRLKPEEYWEWRTTISEMNEANLKYKICDLELKLMQREAELRSQHIKIYSLTTLMHAKENSERFKNEYDKMKKRLEEIYGISLNNKMIDDINFEIKDVPIEGEA